MYLCCVMARACLPKCTGTPESSLFEYTKYGCTVKPYYIPPINCQPSFTTTIFPCPHFRNVKFPRSLKLQTHLPPFATHFIKQPCLFLHKFPRNFHHATLCGYGLADKRCHRLTIQVKSTAVVQIIAVNNAQCTLMN